MEKVYAGVYLLDAPYHLDRIFEYYVPEELREGITEGSFVTVPFGGGNRRENALVFSLSEKTELDADKIKPISGIVNSSLVLNGEMRGLALFLKDYTFCTVGEAVRCMLPSAAFDRMSEVYSLTEQTADSVKMSEKSRAVYEFISKNKRVNEAKLKKAFGADFLKITNELVRAGYLKKELEIKESEVRYTEFVRLSSEYLDSKEKPKVRGEKQQALIDALADGSEKTAEELKKSAGIAASVIKALENKGIVTVRRSESYRNPYGEEHELRADENILSEEQTAAAEQITALYESGEAKAVLLHGVTGSGKTRVIKSMIDRVIADNRSVIVLVPEISLTPQTVGIFLSYYKDRIAVVHSSLSPGERLDAWRRMKNGDADICIGTRSAVFAPFENLGMIVIDEEQEHTYKSDMSPKYHAKDVARYRCAKQNALMLLSSATPSLESYYKAKIGKYTLVELKNRYGSAELPTPIIADMRVESQSGKISPIGGILHDEVLSRLNSREQSILFINRRGYNNFLSCIMCGNVIMCPHCSVSLTYHSKNEREGEHNGYLFCHYCGYKERVPQKCPACGSEHIRYVGFGTQKIENELGELFPNSSVLRMDANTTSAKFSPEGLLERFRRGNADIMIGTQMVAKGHDFPDVTLVGVVNADSAFYLDDYRANERTFSLLTQVIGRAGRGDKKGKAVIQTYNPEFPILKLACSQDYAEFYKNEIELRRALVFPPFCDIVMITLTSDEEIELGSVCSQMKARIDELLSGDYNDVSAVVFGPLEAPLYRINEKYRMRFVIKCRMNGRTRIMLRQLLCEFGKKTAKKMVLSADVNPSSI